jgi:non-ribosomal peptide synthetase component F
MADMIGLFINTLPVRVTVPTNRPFGDWLPDLQADRGRLPAEHTSLADIAEWSEIPPRQPLFTSIVVFGNYPVEEPVRAALGNMSTRSLRVREMNNFPLSLIVNPGPPCEAELQYDRSLLARSTIDGIAEGVSRILAKVVTDPDTPLTDLIDLVDPR